MKIKNAKFTKIKKPLSEKDKGEKKRRIKHIFKIVLDVIVYAFAGFMLIGLIFGSTQYKKTDASFYSDNYTSLNSVSTTRDDSLRLYYYYTVDYKKTFPDFGTLVSAGATQYGRVTLDRDFVVDNIHYNSLVNDIYINANPSRSFIRLQSSNNQTIDLINLTVSDITILRPDIVSSLFGGSYGCYPQSNTTANNNFYKWLVFYLSNKGYTRVNYSMPMNPVSFNYLLVNSVNDDNIRFGGYFFRNDDMWVDFGSTGYQTHRIIMFSGLFRSNGTLFTSIEFGLSTVYGNSPTHSFEYYDRHGVGVGTKYAESSDSFYEAWYYLDYIAYASSDSRVVVWSTSSINYSSSLTGIFLQGTWMGDSDTSTSPYRDLYILYGFDSVTNQEGNFEYFYQIQYASYPQYLNLIGDGYVSQIPGGHQDDNSGYFTSVFAWFSSALTGLLPLFGYSLIPGMTIGTIIMIPISVSIILFVVGLFKR